MESHRSRFSDEAVKETGRCREALLLPSPKDLDRVGHIVADTGPVNLCIPLEQERIKISNLS